MATSNGIREALKTGSARVFFALWPDPAVVGALADVGRLMQRELQGRCVGEDRIHLTLAFVGDVRIERLAELLAVPAGIITAAFNLTLDCRGCWPRSGIGWVAPSQVPVLLNELAVGMKDWLLGAGFGLDDRPFRPHLTLIRKARCVPLSGEITPIQWRVGEIVLVRSRLAADGTRYEKIGAWPLK